jgi:Cu/Ag efflux pump CusA
VSGGGDALSAARQRALLSSLTAILSLLTAVIVLERMGITINTITLGGLAIALGEVVDDAIIDVENVFRRLRENKTLAHPRPVFRVVLDASLEVRSAVVYATFIVAPVVNIFGEDLDVLDAKAREVVKALEAVPGAVDVQMKSPPGTPRITVRLRPDRLTQLGFRPVEVLDAIETAHQGTVVAQTYRGNEVADVAVILTESSRQDPQAIGSLLLRNSQGTCIPLGELADVYPTSGRDSIMHEGARRRQTVTCATSGRDVTSFVADAKKQVAAKVSFPGGTYAVFSGAAQAQAQAQQQLLLHSAIAAVGILLLLTIALGNARNLFLVLVNVPFSLVGGILAVWLTQRLGVAGEGGLTIGSLVGFVTLFGITTRNSIMMISHFEHLVGQEGMTWGLDAAMRGASERLIPILMTATVTALGLLPLALGTGEAGREIEGPMAIVILGGLITSTALNLFVLLWPSATALRARSGQRMIIWIKICGENQIIHHPCPITCMMAKMTKKPATVDNSAVSGGFFSWASGNRSLAPR